MTSKANPNAGKPRGDYKPAQISPQLVEEELMKFAGEIANW